MLVTQVTICEKCGETFRREIRTTDPELNDPFLSNEQKVVRSASNTGKAFCPSCETKFIEWMRKKGYLATDCWCFHISEYKEAYNG